MIMDAFGIIMIVSFCAVCALIIFLFNLSLNKKKQKEQERIDKLTERLPEVEYTEIISSSNGEGGTVTTFDSNGDVGFGSYGSAPSTKFLVVYKSGEKEIVNLYDGIPLVNEYVRLLKK